MKNYDIQIIVTGASGYVGEYLLPSLYKKYLNIVPVDLIKSKYVLKTSNICDKDLIDKLNIDTVKDTIIINLASARFDFGVKANDYLNSNVISQKIFLENIDSLNIIKFIHISSVAAIEGAKIQFNKNLNCDNAYRSTKYMQGELIKEWCIKKNIDYSILYPSAIFSNHARKDTNIGKLQNLSKFIPFVPAINVQKSLTYLPNFCNFIIQSTQNKRYIGEYLTIEKHVLTVSEIASCLITNKTKVLTIPYLKFIMYALAYLLYIIGGFGMVDMKLTPNRVKKLFSDTQYNHITGLELDKSSYNLKYNTELMEILKKIGTKR